MLIRDGWNPTLHKYPIVTGRDYLWGTCVVGIGTNVVDPGERDFLDERGVDLRKERRTCDYFHAILLTSGRGFLHSEQTGELPLIEGDVFILFPGVWHSYGPDLERGWSECFIRFKGDRPDRLVEHGLLSPRSPIYHTEPGSPIRDMFLETRAILRANLYVRNRILAAELDRILAHLITSNEAFIDTGEGLPPDFIRAREWMENDLRRDFKADELANMLCLSYSSVRRLFKSITGLAPQQFHMQLRMSLAKEMLIDPNSRVKEVASHLGFRDPYYFSRVFKQQTGYWPEEWKLGSNGELEQPYA